MQFVKTDSWAPGTQLLIDRLTTALSTGQKVLWLVPGGSNIAAVIKVMQALTPDLTAHLTITLTDERYGVEGFADSNAAQLLAQGFDTKQAVWLPVLVGDRSLAETRLAYEVTIRQALNNVDTVIGQFGIGPDGHICGILPGSPATASPDMVAAYEAPSFTRVTLTAHALKHLNVAVAMVFGDDKHEALLRLRDETIPYVDQPSQILKELPEAYVYNDQIGDNV
jgi:6-phosphogluconolactonase/glucosamine-6-phosphate isomerase/deaminase